MASVKTCFKCLEVKSLDEFYRHAMMADGHLGKCKACTKSDSTAHRASNIERYRAYDRGRGSRQAGNIWRTLDPRRTACHNAVTRAIHAGTLHRQPCEVCQSIEHIHAHHDDYSKPLEVRWLCAAHHRQWHRDNPEVK